MHPMRRLLLIDDDERLGPPLAAYFRRFEFELKHATRPGEGLTMLRSGGFDAVLFFEDLCQFVYFFNSQGYQLFCEYF